jgi:hypothetical protein
MNLRVLGIYCLPNGRELVVLRNDEHEVVLFGHLNGERFAMDEVSVNEAGRLVFDGRLTAWDISNLRDSGRTSPDLSDRFKARNLNRK